MILPGFDHALDYEFTIDNSDPPTADEVRTLTSHHLIGYSCSKPCVSLMRKIPPTFPHLSGGLFIFIFFE